MPTRPQSESCGIRVMPRRTNHARAVIFFLFGKWATPNSLRRVFWTQPLGRETQQSSGKDWNNSEPDKRAP